MAEIVAPGREVSINGRRYRAGDKLPDVKKDVREQLEKSKAILGDEKKQEPKK